MRGAARALQENQIANGESDIFEVKATEAQRRAEEIQNYIQQLNDWLQAGIAGFGDQRIPLYMQVTEEPEEEVEEEAGEEFQEGEGQEPDSEGELELAQPEAEPEVLEGEQPELEMGGGDAQYHQYTGRGPRAKHQSEMYEMPQFHEEPEERGFQQDLIRRLEEGYETRIREKENEIREKREEIGALRNEHSEYDAAMEAYEQIIRLDDSAKEKKSQSENSRARADYLARLMGAASAEYTKIGNKAKKLIAAAASATENDRKHLDAGSQAMEELRNLYARQRQGETVIFAERRKKRQRNIIRNSYEKIVKNEQKWNACKRDVYNYARPLEELGSQYQNISRLRQQMLSLAERFMNEAEAAENERATLFGDNQANFYTDWFARGLNARDEQSSLEKETEDLQRRKDNVQGQVLGADMLMLPFKDRDVRGMYVDGQMHLEFPEEENLENPGEFDEKEMKRIIEEQKIVNALKQREIFQYLNSDNLMEYLTYDDGEGDFRLPDEADQEGPEADNENPPLSGAGLAWKGFRQGFGNLVKKGVHMGGDMLGISQLIEAAKARKTRDSSLADNQISKVYTGLLSLLHYASMGADTLSGMISSGAVPKFVHDSIWGNLNFLGLDLTKASSISAIGAVGSGITIASGLAKGIYAGVDKAQLNRAADKRESLGQTRYGRILREASVVKAVQEFNSYMGAVMGGVSLAFKFTGIGGLFATGITTISNTVIKMIAGAVKRKGQKNSVLNSQEVLGGIQYDKKLISDKDFNLLLANVTGINSRDELYNAIKITDSINVHYAMRKSIARPDPDVDSVMRALGFRNRSRYRNIRLKDIQKKIGYSGDWKEGLHHAMEIRGVDYDTNFTRFVKGVKGLDYYDKKEKLKRPSRQEMMRARRERLQGNPG